MNLLQLLLILKARYKIILITFLVTVITAFVVVSLLPKSYKATTSLLLNYKGMDPVTGLVLPAQLMPGYMATQVDIINSRNIALKVVNELGLANNDLARQQFLKATDGKGDIHNWLADSLLTKLDVVPSKESSVIEINYSSVDPDFAAIIANAFADKYQSTSVQLKVDPALKASEYFTKQIKVLRDDLKNAQDKLSKYQQEKGITNPEQTYDIESTRLNELSSQLSVAQAAAIDTQSRNANAQANAASSPDVGLSPVLQSLRIDATKAESKLAELSQRLSKNHPEYQAAESELAKIKSQMRDEMGRASSTVASSASINQQRESQLRTQVEQQKKRLLALNLQRGESSVLQKDVELAQKSIDAITSRFGQTNIEGHSEQSDIALLNPAIAPQDPSSPRKLIAMALAVMMGGILGLGFAFIAELLDRRVRCTDDISALLEVPVFAMIESKRKKPIFLMLGQSPKLLGSA